MNEIYRAIKSIDLETASALVLARTELPRLVRLLRSGPGNT